MEYDALLTNARFMFGADGTRLHGNIWHDSAGRYKDGEVITTSRLITQLDAHIFQTRNTRYLVVLAS